MGIAAAILTIAAAIAVAVVLGIRAARQAAERDAAWREFARKSGYRMVVPSSAWPWRKRPYIEGEVNGVSFVLELHVVSTGKTHIVFTRLRARSPRGVDAHVIVRPRNKWLGGADRWFQGPIVEVGDRAFDERMLVRCASRDVARELLDEPVRKLMLRLPRRVRFEASGKDVVLRWRNAERDVDVLATAVGIIAALAPAHARA